MLMCLDYIKDLRLTERKGGKSANGKSPWKRHYYITANAHKTSPIKIRWQFYILLNTSKAVLQLQTLFYACFNKYVFNNRM